MRRHLVVGLLCAAVACGESPTEMTAVDLVVSSAAVGMQLGDTAIVTATVVDASGEPVPETTVRWSSNGTGIVLVSQLGVITGIGSGTATVVVEHLGISTDVTVTVGVNLVSIASGAFHTCGATANGLAACWGSNASGKLGTGTLFGNVTPGLVTGLSTPSNTVIAGGSSSCALDGSGRAFCWGSNTSGQLGVGSLSGTPQVSAVPVSGGLSFVHLTSGDRHACGLTATGEAYCWGGGGWGQLGVGLLQSICNGEPCELRPRQIENFTFTALDAGKQHTCGIVAGGAAYCWGVNVSGAVGDSSTTPTFFDPNPVVGGHQFQSIAGADDHTCAISTGGTAYCWGINGDGQLGDSSGFTRRFPVPALGGITFETVTAGGTHTCALTSDGTAYCWGQNLMGQLGTGGRQDSAIPATVSTSVRFTSITAGATHNCAMSTDGEAYCWGWNITGQLGVGSGRDRLVPARVLGQ